MSLYALVALFTPYTYVSRIAGRWHCCAIARMPLAVAHVPIARMPLASLDASYASSVSERMPLASLYTYVCV